MRDEKQGVVVVDMARMPKTVQGGNPITQLRAKYEELETGLKTWLGKQPLAVEATVVTLTNAVQGAVIGGFMGTLTKDMPSIVSPPPNLNSDALASFQQAQVSFLVIYICRSFSCLKKCIFCFVVLKKGSKNTG